MRLFRCSLLAAAALTASADVTIRYEVDTSISAVSSGLSGPSVIRMKGTKGAMSFGAIGAILDFTRREVTLVDPAGKRYATMPSAEWSSKLKAAFPSAEAFGVSKPKVESRKTGRTAAILGIQAEESESVLSIEGEPMPNVSIRMVSHIWTPKAEEVLRVPAIRELTAFNAWWDFLSPVPDQFGDIGNVSVILRLDMALHMKGMSDDGPLFEMKMEAAEISVAALDDALFQIPAGFTAAPTEELLKSVADRAVTDTPETAAPAGVKAFVPGLAPLVYPDRTEVPGVQGMVSLLLTIDQEGGVTAAEALTGPEKLRPAAVTAIRKARFRPVIRDGHPVAAMTTYSVPFFPANGGYRLPTPNLAEEMAANERTSRLERAFPRTPKQVLADLEQNLGGGDAARRVNGITELARAAFNADEIDKAATYAREALKWAAEPPENFKTDARFQGEIILGHIALRNGNLAEAKEHLLAAGKVDGSPVLSSFGPDMSLAKELLAKGETGGVLDYLALCRNFWKMGGTRLDAWEQAIRAGKTPDFGFNAEFQR